MKVLFCPLASPGYVLPAIAVARRLRARGHDVAFVAAPAFGRLLASVGLPRLGGDASSTVGAWHDPRAIADQARGIGDVLGGFPADVLVAGALHVGALLVGARAGIPVAVLGLLGDLPPGDPQQAAELAAALPPGVRSYRGDRYLRRSVPELAGSAPDGTVLVGACTWEPPAPDAVRTWLAASDVPVAVVLQARSFGGRGFWREACALRGVRIAASTSRMDERPGEVPADALVGPFVPQEVVLPRAEVVVCSGTTTAAVGALAHGVPLVVVPEGSEQHDVAGALTAAGVAIRLDAGSLTPAALQAAVDEVRGDPRYRARAAGLARAFAQIDGPERAADAILSLQGHSRSP